MTTTNDNTALALGAARVRLLVLARLLAFTFTTFHKHIKTNEVQGLTQK